MLRSSNNVYFVIQGIGTMIMLGAGTQKSMEINFSTVLCCRTFKYSIFGGVKVQSELPVVIDKCVKGVRTVHPNFMLQNNCL